MDKGFKTDGSARADRALPLRRLRMWVQSTRRVVSQHHAHVNEAHATKRMLKRFASNPRGSALVEFAFVMPVFIGFIFVLIETSLLFLNTSMMDIGLQSVKKMISTGEINNYSGNDQEKKLRERFCENLTALIKCGEVQFDIRSFSKYSSIGMASPIVNGVLNTKEFSRDFGSACSIVVVRAYYETFTTSILLRADVQNLETLRSVITSSVAFKNEEYAGC